jgi:WXG100 family type VII secretion target
VARHVADTARIEAMVDELQAITAALDTALTNAQDSVDRLHGQWEGDGAVAHLTAHEAWRANTEEMHAALRELKAIAEGAHGNYTSAATTNVGMWE